VSWMEAGENGTIDFCGGKIQDLGQWMYQKRTVIVCKGAYAVDF